MCKCVCAVSVCVQVSRRCSSRLQVYKQKVKHLLYEHQNNLTEMKAEGTVVMKLAQKEHRTQEGALRKDMRALKAELKEQELASEVVVKNLRLVGARAGCWGRPAPGDSVATGSSRSCVKGPTCWQLIEIVKKSVHPNRPALGAKYRIPSQA